MPGHTRLPTSESTALRLARASTINSHTPDADCTRRPLLSGARRYARRYGGAPSARAPYRDQTQRRSRDLRATEAPSPSARGASPFAFVKVSRDRVRSVRPCQVRRNVDIVVHLFNQHFLLLHSGEDGWGTPPTAGPDPAPSSDVHTYIVYAGLRVWVSVHCFCICPTEQAL
jgi:hypothetical protein